VERHGAELERDADDDERQAEQQADLVRPERISTAALLTDARARANP
jgi:hypothetical protein